MQFVRYVRGVLTDLLHVRGRDRAVCLFYFLFAAFSFVAVVAIAAYYAYENRSHGALGVVGGFFRDALANPAAWFIYADLTLVWIALGFYMIGEARRLGIPYVWAYIAGAPLCALSVSFPAFMIVRQLKLAAGAPLDSRVAATSAGGSTS
jgi:magnesium-transporting ATPase (P-type)